jgi:hypothetical protein
VADLAEFDLQYQLSEGEFCKAHRSHLQRSMFTVKNLVLLTTALGIGAIQAQMFGGADWALRVFAGLWLVVLVFMVWAYVFLPGRLYRNGERYSGAQRLQTEEGGFTLQQGDRKGFLAWSEVVRVSESEGSVLLHRKQQVPILIPERAFGSAEQRASFHERVERARIDVR